MFFFGGSFEIFKEQSWRWNCDFSAAEFQKAAEMNDL